VGRSVSRGRDRAHACVPELDLRGVVQLFVLELDTGLRRQVRRRPGRVDESRQARDVIGLHVRLEDGHDRRTGTLGLIEVCADERLVRIDHGELPLGQAAEQIRRTRRLRVQKRTQDHPRNVRPHRQSR
jgi:hypothetical protein